MQLKLDQKRNKSRQKVRPMVIINFVAVATKQELIRNTGCRITEMCDEFF